MFSAERAFKYPAFDLLPWQLLIGTCIWESWGLEWKSLCPSSEFQFNDSAELFLVLSWVADKSYDTPNSFCVLEKPLWLSAVLISEAAY